MAGLNYITASFGEEIKTWEEHHQQFKCVEQALRRHFRISGHIEAVQRPVWYL